MRRLFLHTLWALLWVIYCSPALAAESIEWQVRGAPDDLAENIELHLQSLNQLNGQQDDRWLLAMERAILQAARALGYYHLTYDWQRDADQVVVTVEPGDPVRWHAINLELVGTGQSEEVLQQAKQTTPFSIGEPINQGQYDNFKTQWLNKARSLGYRDARYRDKSLRLNLKTLQARVRLTLDTGEPYFVESVRFEGSKLSSALLDKLVFIKPGDRYQAALLSNLYGQLLDTGYFEQINILPVKVAPQKMAIEVSLLDAAKHTFTVGAGVSTDTGPRLRFGWDRPMITEGGHQLHSQAQVSGVEQRLSSEYRIPISNPLNHYFAFDGGWRHKSVEDTETRIWETSFSHHSIHHGWQHTYKVGIEDEKYQQGGDTTQEVFYVIPGVSWSLTRLQGDPNMPDGGHKLWLGVEASTVDLGSDTDFFRVVTGAKWFGLFAQRHEIHARFEVGAIQAGQYEDVPASRRFFTGGDQSVRGFDFESLAPKDEDGDLIGGRYLNVAGLEYRWRWRERWFLALFSDIGRAYNYSSDSFHQGAGFGVHWQSPVGPIRFDLATPIDDAEHDGWRIHLTMGTAL